MRIVASHDRAGVAGVPKTPAVSHDWRCGCLRQRDLPIVFDDAFELD